MTSFTRWLRRLKRMVGRAEEARGSCPPLRFQPLLEALEDRVTPSTAAATPFYVTVPSHASPQPQSLYFDPATGGFTPLGIETAYGVTSLFGAGDEGAGQTIAVVDAYDNPFFSSTATPGFADSDLAEFDSIFGLADPPSFTKVGEVNPTTFSTTTFPGTDPANDWEGEEALDVEWAHAIAPQANIILVECTDATTLFDGVAWAEKPVASGGGGATVISMSFGTAGGYVGENASDSYFDPALYPGVTFLASADDSGSGSNGTPNDGTEITGQAAYPSDSPYVVSVGGTSLTMNDNTGAYLSEGVWNDGFDAPNDDYEATGGGISAYESQPTYQDGLTIHNGAATVAAGGMRAAPDVSFLADPQTGVDVYDTYDGNGAFTFFGDPSNMTVVGGTSLSSPSWAGLVAIADQIRVNDGEPTLTGATQTLPTLYNIYNSPAYGQDFNDITSTASPNDNGTWTAGVGYDLDTGIGSPIANNLVPALADVNQLVYTAPISGTNNFLLQKNGANLDLYDNAILVASDPLAEVTAVDIAGETDNALTIDYTGIATNFAVTFDGGSGTGAGLAHTLTLENGAFTNETYTYSGAESGVINLDGQTVTYADVTSSTNTTTVSNLTINLPTGAQATVLAGAPAGEISGTGFPTSGFEDPSSSFTINTGGGGSLVNLEAMDGAFQPASETFSGAVGDIFRFMSGAAVPTQTALTVNAVSLDLNGFSPSINGLNGNGTITDSTASAPTLTVGAGNGSGTFSGVIQDGSGTLAFTKAGTGIETLAGFDSFSGAVTITGGTLEIGGADAIPASAAVSDDGILELDSFDQQVASITGVGVVDNASGTSATFTVNNGAADDFAGTLTGNLALAKSSGGTLTLSGAGSSYTGATTIDAGTVADGVANALPTGTALGVAGTLDLAGFGQEVGSVTGAGTVTDSGAAAVFTIDNSGADVFAGVLSGSLGLTKSSLGTLTLTNLGVFTGATDIVTGTVADGIANALPIGTDLTVGGTLDLAGFSQEVSSITGAGTITDSGAAAVFTVNNAAADPFDGTLTGNLALTKSNAGALTLGSANSYLGATTIGAGTLADGITNALPIGTALSDGGTLDLAGFAQQVAGVTGTGGVTNSSATAATFTINNGAADVFAGPLTLNLALTKAGAGPLTLTSAGSYTGATAINAGTLIDGIADALPTTTALSVTGTLDLAGNSQEVGAVTGAGTVTNSSGTAATFTVNDGTADLFAGAMTGSGLALTKLGIGTLTLSGASNYAGVTSVSGGSLIVNGSISSNVTVATGASLGGTGATGKVTVQNGGTLYGGATINTLATDDLNLQAGAAFDVAFGPGPSSSTDTVVAGAVSLGTGGTGVTLNLTGLAGFDPVAGDVFPIIDNSAAFAQPIAGTFVAGAGIDNVAPGAALPEDSILSTHFLGTNLFAFLTYQAGPEHDSAAVLVNAGGPMNYTGGLAQNNFLLIEDAAGNIDLYDNGLLVKSQIAIATTSVGVGVLPGDNATLTIDYSGGKFAMPVSFDGGTGTGVHTLTVQNGAFSMQTFTYTGPQAGNLKLDTQTVTFADVTSIADTSTQGTLVLNLPAGALASVQDDGNPTDGLSAINNSGTNAAFSPTTFTSPASSFTVATAGGGSFVQLAGMDDSFSPHLETLSGAAGDIFQLETASVLPDLPGLTLTTATLDLNGISPTIDALNGTGTITDTNTAAATLTIGANGGAGSFAGIVQDGVGGIGLLKAGAGTETLSGANTYSGATLIDDGTLQLGAANALPGTSDVLDDATLDLHGFSDTIGALTGDGLVTSTLGGAPVLTVGADGAGGTFAGSVQNGAADLGLTKQGAGTEILTGTSNSYAGGTNVTGGILQVGAGTTDGSIGSGAVAVAAAGTLQFDSAASSAATAANFANNISGAGTISVISANAGNRGAVAVSGANGGFIGALNISGGSYQLGNASALGSPASINVSGTGQFYFGAATALTVNAPITLATLGYPDTVGTLGAVRFAGAADVLAGPVTIDGTALVSAYQSSGTISGPIGGGTLEVGSGLAAETIVLTGANNYAGTVINPLATLQIGNAGTTGSLGTSGVTDNGQLAFDRGDTVTIADNIAGAGGLAQTGAGTLILPAATAFTYQGATSVSSGVLQVDADVNLNIGVSGTGTLTGTGAVAGVNATGGTLNPGDAGAPGTLATGGLNLSPGAAFSAALTNSSTYSQDNVTAGAVTLNGVTLNLSAFGTFTPVLGDQYLLIDNGAASAQPIDGIFLAGAGVTNVAPGTPLTEGTDLSDNFLGSGLTAIITYQAGPNHDSVGLLMHGPLKFTGTQSTNNFLLQEDAGGNLDLYDNTLLVATQPVLLTTTVSVGVAAAGENASLTIDYSGGLFTNPVNFDGGTGSAAHALTLQNGAFGTETFGFTGAKAGSIAIDGQMISFADVASIADLTAESNLVFNLPAGAKGAVQDDGTRANGVSALSSSNATFVANTTFADPAAALTVNGGGAGSIQLTALDADFAASSLTLSGQASDTFVLGGVSALPSAVTLTVSGATLNLNGLSPTIAGLTGAGTITNAAAATSTLTVGFQNGGASFAGIIKNGTGSVALTKIGAGVQILAGADSYTGATTITAGTLQLGAAAALSASSDIADNGILDLAGFAASAGALSGSGIVTNSAAGAAVLTVGADAHTGVFAGVIKDGAGTLGLTKSGTGTETLSGADTYSGPTAISAGTLQAGKANALSPNSDVADAATLDLHGFAGTIGALTGKGSVTNSASVAATLTVGADGDGGSFAGVIKNGTGVLALTKAGAGVQTLAAVNTYTGSTTIAAGTLQLGIGGAVSASSDVADNGILDLNRCNDSIGALSGAGVVTDSAAGPSALSVGADGHSGVFAGAIQNGAGIVSLTKIGAGTQTLAAAANIYSGITLISAGVLQAGAANSFSPNSDVTDNATLDLHGNAVTVGAFSGSGSVTSTVSGPASLTLGASGDSGSFAGAIKNGTGTVSLAKTGAGVQTLTGAVNSFTGATTLSQGTLTLKSSLYPTAFGVVNLNGPNVTLDGTGTIRGQVDVTASDATIESLTVTTAIGGTGILVAGPANFTEIGPVTINGGNSTSVGILVQGGAVIFNSKISGHNIDVNVNGGSAVLQGNTLNAGTGSFATGLQVENGGIVDAGQFAADATPLTNGPTGNVGLYGDITGLFSGVPLGSSGHSSGGNVFDSYTASTSATNPNVPQAIRDLNTGLAPFGPLLGGVETSFIYGGAQLGRMDLTARNDTFNGVLNAANATIEKYVFDSHRQTGTPTLGYVLYGLPQLTVSPTALPQYVPPGGSFSVLITYDNVGPLPTFGVIKVTLSAGESFDPTANPGWVYQGNNVATFELGLLPAGFSGVIPLTVDVIALPTTTSLSLTTVISPDLISGLTLDSVTVATTTTALGKKGRLT